MMTILRDIDNERMSQIRRGYDAAHDDQHRLREIAAMAGAYAARAAGEYFPAHQLWPWDQEMSEQESDRRDLIIAAALIVAEIERIDRTAVSS